MAVEGIASVDTHLVVPTTRPTTHAPPSKPGLYVHRWFLLEPHHVDEKERPKPGSPRTTSPNQDIDTLAGLFTDLHPDPTANPQLMATLRGVIQSSPMMQCILEEQEQRLFTVQRYCFRGAIDDWISLDQGTLAPLVRKYIKHLGNESYFELV